MLGIVFVIANYDFLVKHEAYAPLIVSLQFCLEGLSVFPLKPRQFPSLAFENQVCQLTVGQLFPCNGTEDMEVALLIGTVGHLIKDANMSLMA